MNGLLGVLARSLRPAIDLKNMLLFADRSVRAMVIE
jgi:hypothetical protein